MSTLMKQLANSRIVQPELSLESFSDLMKSVRNLFAGNQKKDRENLKNPRNSNQVDETKVAEYVKKYFGNTQWANDQKYNLTVPNGRFVQALSVDGKFVNTLSALKSSITTFKTLEGNCRNQLKSMDDKVQAVYKKYSGQILAAIKKDDKAEVTQLTQAAVKEFEAIPIPFKAGQKFSWLGGEQAVVEASTGRSKLGIDVSRNTLKVTAPATVKALTASEVVEAAQLVTDLISYGQAMEKRPYLRWLDFEDGSTFSDAIQDYSESDYDDFYDRWYFQNVMDIQYGLPDARGMVHATIIALLTWMDGSIK